MEEKKGGIISPTKMNIIYEDIKLRGIPNYLMFTKQNGTFDLAKHNLLVSRVLLLDPFQLLLRIGQRKI